MGTQLVWLKRDLRLEDHQPLHAAAKKGPVALLYIFEPSLAARSEVDPSHLHFVRSSLLELGVQAQSQASVLWVSVGEVVDVLDQLHASAGFEALHAHEETGLMVTYERDKAVHRWAKSKGLPFFEYPQFGVFRPHPSRTGWARRWQQRMSQPILSAPTWTPVQAAPSQVAKAVEPGLVALDAGLWASFWDQLESSPRSFAQKAGRGAGLNLLASFLDRRGQRYPAEMSAPSTAVRSCSRLSTHLAYGTLSMKEVWQATSRRKDRARIRREKGWETSLEAFEGRLRWHCHFIQKLEDEPELEFRNAHRGYDGLRDESPLETWSAPRRAKFDAWIHGQTGFPMVDACMRCLHKTGWINFRMRAMLASFACHHLWLHWRAPAVALAPLFLDFEPGIHFAQFQMQAGTAGINTTRVYNVVKQAREQDPTGAFIRSFCPELQGVSEDKLAEPNRMSPSEQAKAGCVIGQDYPRPIVDHAQAGLQAKARLDAMKRRVDLQAERSRVHQKHGSRRPPRILRRR